MTVLREEVWKKMLTAELNERYWQYLTQRYVKYDKWLKIFLAIMSSGTVASWSIWKADDYAIIWKSLSSISAVVAMIQPFLNYAQVTKETEQLAHKWIELASAYQSLWFEVENDLDEKKIKEAYKKIENMQVDIEKREIKIPVDKKLICLCQSEVKKLRGLIK